MLINPIPVGEFYARLLGNDGYRKYVAPSQRQNFYTTYNGEVVTDVTQARAGKYTIWTNCDVHTVGPYERIVERKSVAAYQAERGEE
jgi:hypothetical protein